jgi:hypothetical protein
MSIELYLKSKRKVSAEDHNNKCVVLKFESPNLLSKYYKTVKNKKENEKLNLYILFFFSSFIYQFLLIIYS